MIRSIAKKSCRDCKWNSSGYCYTYQDMCRPPLIENERDSDYGCGPSGSYWEPKESEE